jgi:hypothetical protein
MLPFQNIIDSEKCIVCNFKLNSIPSLHDKDIYYFNCPRCGHYALNLQALINFDSEKKRRDFAEKKLLIISNNIYYNFQYPNVIDTSSIDRLLKVTDKNLLEKLDFLLLSLYQNEDSFGLICPNENKNLFLEVNSWLCGINDYIGAMKILQESGYINVKINISGEV